MPEKALNRNTSSLVKKRLPQCHSARLPPYQILLGPPSSISTRCDLSAHSAEAASPRLRFFFCKFRLANRRMECYRSY
jgi:hypothetical protein